MMVHFPQHWSACPGYTILANLWVISSERQRIRQDLSPAQEELQDGEEATYSRPASLPWELEPITSPLTLICKMRTLDRILPRSLPVLTFYDQSASFPISWRKENLFFTFSSMKLKIKSPVKWKFISHSRVARNEVNNAGLKSQRTSARRHCVLHLMNPPSNRVLLLFLFHRWRNQNMGRFGGMPKATPLEAAESGSKHQCPSSTLLCHSTKGLLSLVDVKLWLVNKDSVLSQSPLGLSRCYQRNTCLQGRNASLLAPVILAASCVSVASLCPQPPALSICLKLLLLCAIFLWWCSSRHLKKLSRCSVNLSGCNCEK